VFRYLGPGDGADTIEGFASGQDRMEFAVLGFSGLSEGADLLAAGRFVVSATGLAETAALGQFIWHTGARRLLWDPAQDARGGRPAARRATPGQSWLG
jgi:hypothetical protein